MLTTTRAAREALRRGLGLTPARRLSGTTGGASGAPVKPKDGRRQAEEMTPEQIEELSVFRATGGLVMAATGGIGVFVIGAAATLGVASGAAHLLGHSMNSKRLPPARPPTVEELRADLAALRARPSSAETDAAKADLKRRVRDATRAARRDRRRKPADAKDAAPRA